MTKKEEKVIEKAIHEIDTATGMLIIASMMDRTIREAMEKLTQVSIKLGNLF